ncbi:MAG: hypothetical protein MZV63_15460 [Marinilabiliales bacterium]|nr:hypothetical protein [Marinilabiliales bacterium]
MAVTALFYLLILAGIMAGLIPARKAVSMKPVDALAIRMKVTEIDNSHSTSYLPMKKVF